MEREEPIVVMTYDRRAPQELLDALATGFASSLREYVLSGQYPVDLQLRGYEGRNAHHATLYVGLTKVLDLHHRPKGRYKLSAHPTYMKPAKGWHESWTKLQSADSLAASWPFVEEYLDTVIPTIGASYLKEGRTQAAVSALRHRSLIPIDREVVIAFSSAAERTATMKQLAQPLLDAIATPNGAAWWAAKPTRLGGECDALAVRDGELLAIEVKPSTASAAAIAWVPLQARHYANLVGMWAATHPNAAEVINGMVQQRTTLGLTQGAIPPVEQPLTVRPVVVLQHGCSDIKLKRLWEVQSRLAAAACNEPGLEVLALTPAGRLKPLSPTWP